jgi:hypothetical protein
LHSFCKISPVIENALLTPNLFAISSDTSCSF